VTAINRPGAAPATTGAAGSIEQPADATTTPASSGTATAAEVSGTAPVAAAGDLGVHDTSGPSGVSGRAHDLAERGVERLREMSWNEIRAAHDLGTDLGSNKVGLGIRVKADILDDKEMTPLQKQTAERMEAELRAQDPERELKVRFVETRGVMKPRVGLSKSGIGGIGAAVGFSASSPVEYRAVRPYVFEGDSLRELANGTNAEAVGQVLKDNTLELPHDSEDLMKMPPGSEIELIGKGTFSVTAGLSVGVSEEGGLGPVEWRAGASLAAGHTRTGSATISSRVRVLEDNQVNLKNAVVDDHSRSTWLRANAGLSIDADGLLDEVPGLASSSTLVEALRGPAAGAIEDTVRKLSAFHASAAAGHSERKIGINAFNLDLNDPDARRLFDDTNRLKTKTFSDAARREGSGVRETRYTEELDSDGRSAEVRFAGKKLFLYKALRQTREGRLDTDDGGFAMIRTGSYERTRNVLGWRRQLSGEGVHVTHTKADGSQEQQDYFHGVYNQLDKTPRGKEVGRLRRFVDGMGIEGSDKLQEPDGNFLSRFFGGGDNLTIGVDTYITRDGLGNILEADEGEIRSAYRDAMTTLDPSLGEIPINNALAIAQSRAYLDLKDESGGSVSNSETNSVLRQMGVRYAEIIGSDQRGWRAEKLLRQHSKVFEGADQSAANILEAGGRFGEGEWTRAVPNIMEDMRFRYDSGLLTLANLAGRDNVLVHQLSIESKDGDTKLVAEDEGSLRHPDEMVNDALDHP